MVLSDERAVVLGTVVLGEVLGERSTFAIGEEFTPGNRTETVTQHGEFTACY